MDNRTFGDVIFGDVILEWPFRGRHSRMANKGDAILEWPFSGRHFGDIILEWPNWGRHFRILKIAILVTSF